jgi:hypothetical protein
MHKFKKEIQAILGGMAFAYFFQLFGLLMVFIDNYESDLLIAKAFIPTPSIQLAMAPMMSWFFMGLLRVRWLNKWRQITAHAFAFLFPFIMIAMITLYINANLWHSIAFWIVNAIISLIAAFTLFRSFLK